MTPIRKNTLQAVLQELACHPCEEAELNELVTPAMGIISGFQDLLNDLEGLRKLPLGDLPPAGSIQYPVGRTVNK
jgi:hypothetical protein